ncbi:MAG: hypothetical protein E7603_04120 [Ruminococcaceae bacterium]|nr:hypothetical protein [Oscillospiraceae bacterium]
MKKTNLNRVLHSPWFEKFLLAVYLLLGAYFTNLAFDRELWHRYTLHIFITILAVFFDVLAFQLLRKILKRKAIPMLKQGIAKAFSSVFRRIAKITGRTSLKERDGKIFVEGSEERSFAIERRSAKNSKSKKKMPKLSKNPSEREKARYAYTEFVFKKDKNISSVLTPSEVAVRLDEKGENREIFINYNIARYSDETEERIF